MAAVGGYDSQDDLLVMYGGGAKNLGMADTWFFRYPPPLVGSIFVSLPDPLAGESVAFSSEIEGGSGSFVRFRWSFGDGQTGNGASTVHTFGTPGLYRVEFVVEDSRGEQIVRIVQLSVGLLMPFWVDVSLLFVSLCAVSASIFALVRRHRRLRGGIGGRQGGR